jgi:pimeloyl-ACP methyl ester carboxylesterase
VLAGAGRHVIRFDHRDTGPAGPAVRVTAPTLVSHATADPLLPVPNGQVPAALIPGTRFEAVPGMGTGSAPPASRPRGPG